MISELLTTPPGFCQGMPFAQAKQEKSVPDNYKKSLKRNVVKLTDLVGGDDLWLSDDEQWEEEEEKTSLYKEKLETLKQVHYSQTNTATLCKKFFIYM